MHATSSIYMPREREGEREKGRERERERERKRERERERARDREPLEFVRAFRFMIRGKRNGEAAAAQNSAAVTNISHIQLDIPAGASNRRFVSSDEDNNASGAVVSGKKCRRLH
jgi:hypothetical protein